MSAYVTPGHPVKEGSAGYDCACGECLFMRSSGRSTAQEREQTSVGVSDGTTDARPDHIGWAKHNGCGEIIFRQAGHPANDVRLPDQGWKRIYLSPPTPGEPITTNRPEVPTGPVAPRGEATSLPFTFESQPSLLDNET